MEILRTKKYAEEFIKKDKIEKSIPAPICFYYKDKNKYMCIDYTSFRLREKEFNNLKEVEEYCKNKNKIY